MERPSIYSLDFAQPTVSDDDAQAIGDGGVDVVGAWALEQEARGIRVTDEEIAIQRAMWAAEGG